MTTASADAASQLISWIHFFRLKGSVGGAFPHSIFPVCFCCLLTDSGNKTPGHNTKSQKRDELFLGLNCAIIILFHYFTSKHKIFFSVWKTVPHWLGPWNTFSGKMVPCSRYEVENTHFCVVVHWTLLGLSYWKNKQVASQVSHFGLFVPTSNNAASQEVPWDKGAFLKVLLGVSLKAVVMEEQAAIQLFPGALKAHSLAILLWEVCSLACVSTCGHTEGIKESLSLNI